MNRFKISATYAPTMRMLLSSVIHFKGQWYHEFDPAVPGMFNINSDSVIIAQMMFLRKKLKTNTVRIGNAEARWIELPYKVIICQSFFLI